MRCKSCDYLEEKVWAEGTASAKVPRQEYAFCVSKEKQRPVWLECESKARR